MKNSPPESVQECESVRGVINWINPFPFCKSSNYSCGGRPNINQLDVMLNENNKDFILCKH